MRIRWSSPQGYIFLVSFSLIPVYFLLYNDLQEDERPVRARFSRQDLMHLRNEIFALSQTPTLRPAVVVDWGRGKGRRKKKRTKADGEFDVASIEFFKQHQKPATITRVSEAPLPPPADLVSFQLEAGAHKPGPRGAHFLPRLYVNAVGRYGNNLFQLASAYGLAKETGRQLVISPNTWTAMYMFANNSLYVSDVPTNVTQLTESYAGKYDSVLVKNLSDRVPQEDVLVCCYLQSWRYFYKHTAEIRKLFTLTETWKRVGKRGIARAKERYLAVLRARIKYKTDTIALPENVTLVGVHVRMRDVADPEAQARGYGPAPPQYLTVALTWYRKRYKNPLFIVVTDQIPWCRENFTRYHNDVVIASLPGRADYYQDFSILLHCHHLIITVGTFGWFAGWLSEGTVLYYSDWPTPGTEIGTQYRKSDYFPEHWIPISVH